MYMYRAFNNSKYQFTRKQRDNLPPQNLTFQLKSHFLYYKVDTCLNVHHCTLYNFSLGHRNYDVIL